MKKILCTILMMIMLCSSLVFGVTVPDPIDDDDFIKERMYSSDTFSSPKPISIGGTATGSVGRTGYNGKANTDVYKLMVGEDTLVTFKLSPLEKLYNMNLSVSTLYFIDDVTGEKRSYAPSTIGQQVTYYNYPSYGHYLRSLYLHKGTYYFTVAGTGYSQEGSASNFLKSVPYKIDVVGRPYLQEGNSDSTNAMPYTTSNNSIINGTLGMTHSWGGNRFYKDTNDYIKLPPSNSDLNVKIKVENITSPPLDIFKKDIQYVRNEGNKLETGKSVDTGIYKEHIALSVNLEGAIARLKPGESTELNALVKSVSTNRTIQLMANTISQYRISLAMAPIGQEAVLPVLPQVVTEPVAPTVGSNETNTSGGYKPYKPIIMLHTGDDNQLPASLLDNRNYKIYVNNEDYTTSMKGYMGHITKLPASGLGDTYNLKIEVDGYKPYYETVTIQAPEAGVDHPVIFVTVMAHKAEESATPVKEEVKEDNVHKIGNYYVEQTDSRDGQLIQEGTSLKMIGGSHTNNQLRNNRRDGNAVLTKDKMSFMNKRLDISYTIYGDSYAYFTAGADKVHTGKGATSHHSWAGSILVTNGMRLYKTLIFKGSTYEEYLCTGAYYGSPTATVLYQTSGTLSEAGQKNIKMNQSVYIGFGDNYGGSNAVMTVHDIKLSTY